MGRRFAERDYYDGGGDYNSRKSGLPRFRDELQREKKEKTFTRKRIRNFAPGRTLHDRPSPENLDLIRKSGVTQDLLSSHSFSLLEHEFRRRTQEIGVTDDNVRDWVNGKHTSSLVDVSKIVRGGIFEEIVTREFAIRNPDTFVTNPVLTSKIINKLFGKRMRSRFAMPDHLIFQRVLEGSRLVGFVEDKKYIDPNDDIELFKQLEGEWNVFSMIADSDANESEFRRAVQEVIPSFSYRIRVAPLEESAIWLATTRGTARNVGPMPGWVNVFESSVSEESIDKLSERLIFERFLPNLYPHLAVSPNGN